MPTGGKHNASSSAAPQNAALVSAANALGGLKSLSGAAFALHITAGPNQGHVAQGAAAQANAAQSGAGQSGQNQTSQNQTGQNPDGQNQAGSGADLASNTVLPAKAADHQAIPQTSNLAALSGPALSTWTASGAVPAAPSSPSAALAAPVATSEIDSEDPTGAPQTVRTVQVQLTGEGEARVDLRLVEHAGGLSVSVRASDSTLTKGLQDNLPELSARLAEEKYQTHAFLPAANEAGGSSSSSSEQSSGQATDDQSSGRSFSQGGDGRQSGGQTGGQSDSGQPPDSGAAWRRQMAALNGLSSSLSTSRPITQSTNS